MTEDRLVLSAGFGSFRVGVVVKLIALLIGHPGDASANQGRGNSQNEDAAAQRGDHAGAGTRSLGVAKRAILSEGQGRDGQRHAKRQQASSSMQILRHSLTPFPLRATERQLQPTAPSASCARGEHCLTTTCSSSRSQKWSRGST